MMHGAFGTPKENCQEDEDRAVQRPVGERGHNMRGEGTVLMSSGRWSNVLPPLTGGMLAIDFNGSL